MSGAFTREPDGDQPEHLPELPISPHPNFVTARGLRLLQERLLASEAQAAALSDEVVGGRQALAHMEREQRWLRSRIASANVIPMTAQPSEQVAFGAEVAVRDAQGHLLRYRIVGEEEGDPEHGLISWTSPLARALRGKEVGDVVTWERPMGNLAIEVEEIAYPAE